VARVAVDQGAPTSGEPLEADELRKGEVIYDELVTYLEQSHPPSQIQAQTKGLYLFDKATFWLEKTKKRLPSYTWAHRFLQIRHLKRRLFKENNDTIIFDEMKHAIHEAIGLRSLTGDERVMYMVDNSTL